jgi:hypothetical protein
VDDSDRCVDFTIALKALGKKHAAVFGSTEVPEKRKLLVQSLAFPLFPGVGHNSTFVKGLAGVNVIVLKARA